MWTRMLSGLVSTPTGGKAGCCAPEGYWVTRSWPAVAVVQSGGILGLYAPGESWATWQLKQPPRAVNPLSRHHSYRQALLWSGHKPGFCSVLFGGVNPWAQIVVGVWSGSTPLRKLWWHTPAASGHYSVESRRGSVTAIGTVWEPEWAPAYC